MTPGYGFAYFRWRSLRYLPCDESIPYQGMEHCRYLDYAKFARFQAKP